MGDFLTGRVKDREINIGSAPSLPNFSVKCTRLRTVDSVFEGTTDYAVGQNQLRDHAIKLWRMPIKYEVSVVRNSCQGGHVKSDFKFDLPIPFCRQNQVPSIVPERMPGVYGADARGGKLRTNAVAKHSTHVTPSVRGRREPGEIRVCIDSLIRGDDFDIAKSQAIRDNHFTEVTRRRGLDSRDVKKTGAFP